MRDTTRYCRRKVKQYIGGGVKGEGGYNVSLSSKVTIKITTTSLSSLRKNKPDRHNLPAVTSPSSTSITKQHLSPPSCRRPTDGSHPSTAKKDITTSAPDHPPWPANPTLCVIRLRTLPLPLHPVRRETYGAKGHFLPVTAPQEKSRVIKVMSVKCVSVRGV